MTVLQGSYFRPRLGGHAPADLRYAFQEAIDRWLDWQDEQQEPTVVVRHEEVPVTRMFGLLWNYTDILPDVDCNRLHLPAGSSYAQAARHLMRESGR